MTMLEPPNPITCYRTKAKTLVSREIMPDYCPQIIPPPVKDFNWVHVHGARPDHISEIENLIGSFRYRVTTN